MAAEEAQRLDDRTARTKDVSEKGKLLKMTDAKLREADKIENGGR